MALTAGVDIGGTKIQTVVVARGRVKGQCRVSTPQTGAADVVAAVRDTVERSVQDAGMALTDVERVGIGCPGEIDAAAGVVSRAANVPGMEARFALGPEVSTALDGVPVHLENDVRAATLGEFTRGAGRPYRDLLGVFVGTGVGGGIVLGGKLRHGRGAAGEIGHVVVKEGGRKCPCGRLGCLEAYAGRRSIEATARHRQEKGEHTDLFAIMEKRGRDRVTSGVIARALDAGDKVTAELIDDAVWALGIALASAQNLLDLEAIILGGGLGDRLGPPFVARVEDAMRPHLFVNDNPPAVLPTGLGDLSGAVGAAVAAST